MDEFDIPDLPEAPTLDQEVLQHLMEPVAIAVAMNLDEESVIAQRYGLTDAQLQLLTNIPQFKELVALHKQSWEGADNTTKRIELKAQMALERALLPIAQVSIRPETNDAVRIQAGKLLKEISPLGDRGHQQQGGGGQINLQINLNGTAHALSFDKVIEADA